MSVNPYIQVTNVFANSDLKNISSVVFVNGNKICVQEVKDAYIQAKPLTHVFEDSKGKCIQLWKTLQYGLVGSVLAPNGQLTIIPGDKIRNPLNRHQTSSELIESLEKALRKWEITYNTEQFVLTIWPHLEGAGKDKVGEKESLQKLDMLGNKLNHLRSRQQSAVRTETFSDGRVRYYQVETPSEKPGPTRGSAYVTEHHPLRGTVRSWYESRDHSGRVNRVHPKFINGSDIREIQHYPPTGKELAAMAAKKQASQTPATKNFQTQVQAARLTESYNQTHKKNPIPAKGASGGSIGGVACGEEYIQGLFDTSQALFEDEHFFCVPALPDGKMPFSDGELGQIMRELAIGIYTHGTVPFFSLHFNENSDLYPIIHPVYQNTLVGRVISMLDYIMKGYLNGGVFTEKFVDEWQKNPNWKTTSQTALDQMIDFEQYCAEHQVEYQSLHVLRDEIELLNGYVIDDVISVLAADDKHISAGAVRVLRECTGFRNSFRIIAKQNSVQKEGNLFVLDSDFDVLYTIEPSAEYKEALSQYERISGHMPPSYTSLEQVFKVYCKRIHDDMVKLPICRDYFAMLGVINFFSSYFSTLKKHQKIPVLSSRETLPVKGSPRIFPHLPINKIIAEPLTLNSSGVSGKIFTDFRGKAEAYFNQMRKDRLLVVAATTGDTRNEFKEYLAKEITREMLEASVCPRLVKPIMDSTSGVQDLINSTVDDLLKLFDATAFELIDTLKSRFLAAFSKVQTDENLANFHEKIVRQYKVLIEKYISKLEKDYINCTQTTYEEKAVLSQAIYGISTQHYTSMYDKVYYDHVAITNSTIEYINKCVVHIMANSFGMLEKTIAFLTAGEPKVLATLKVPGTRIFSEITPQEIEKGEKVVGGCGMNLQSQVIRTSTVAKKVIQAHGSMLRSMPVESWREVTYDANQGRAFVFRLKYQNVPAGYVEDYTWMQEQLLVGRAIVPGVDEHGFQPIHIAAMNGSVEVLDGLLQASGNRLLNVKSYNGLTPLITAILYQQVAAVNFLLAKGALFSSMNDGYNTLHCALHQGHMGIIDALLAAPQAPKYINAMSREGGTPLMLACELDSAGLVRKMIALGAAATTVRSDGVTALEIAISRSEIGVIKELLEHAVLTGRVVEQIAAHASLEVLKLVIAKKEMYDYRSGYGETSLHIAVLNGNQPVALELLANSPNEEYLKAVNSDGDIAFTIAASIGAWQVMAALSEKYTVSPVRMRQACRLLLYKEYSSLLEKFILACEFNEAEIQEFALEAAKANNTVALMFGCKNAGAKLEQLQGTNGYRLEHYAAQLDEPLLVNHLFAKPDSEILYPLVEEGGKTLPYIAGENASYRMLRDLLGVMRKRGMSLERHFKDRHLFYPVLKRCDLKVVKLFFDNYSEVKKELANVSLDDTGIRPLHLAAQIGSLKLVRLLLAEGADVSIVDNNGVNVLEQAVKVSHVKMIGYLLEKYGNALITDRVLALAASLENESIFSKLIECGASQKVLDDALYLVITRHAAKAFLRLYQNKAFFSSSGLVLACATGQSGILSIMLKDGRVKELSFDATVAIQEATKNGHRHCLLLLLEAGYLCASEGVDSKEYRMQVQILEQLIAKSSKPEELTQIASILHTWPANERIEITYKGEVIWGTPLHLMLRITTHLNEGLNEVIGKMLQNPKMEPEAQDSKGDTVAHLLLRLGIIPNQQILLRACRCINHNQETILHTAVVHSGAEVVRLLLEKLSKVKGLDLLEAKDRLGNTPIMYAVIRNHLQIVEALAKSGADVNCYNRSLNTPLGYICSGACGSLALLKKLIELGVNQNQKFTQKRISPIAAALTSNKHEYFMCLLRSRADAARAVGSGGHTLAQIAAGSGKSSLFRLLNVADCSLESPDNSGKSPIHYAVIAGDVTAIKQLLGVAEEILNSPVESSTRPVKKKYKPIQGATPLHFSAFMNNQATVEFLLKQKADVDVKTKEGESVISFAAGEASVGVMQLFSPYKMSNDPATLFEAIKQGIRSDNVDLVADMYTRAVGIGLDIVDGYTGLHLASVYGALQVTQWLLQRGADPLLENGQGKDAITLAAENSSVEQFQILLDYVEPDLDELRNDKETLLHTAARAGNIQHILLLLKNFADINVKDYRDNSPLHAAILSGRCEAAKLLLACGADHAALSSVGKTVLEIAEDMGEIVVEALKSCYKWLEEGANCKDGPLHLAVRSGIVDAVRVMAYLCDIDRVNGQQFTALQLAQLIGNHEVVELLQDQMAKLELHEEVIV